MNGKIDWIRVAEFLVMGVAYAFALWRAWVKLVDKVDGLGGRVSKVEENCTKHGTDLDNVKREQGHAREERASLAQAVASNTAKIESIKETIQQERLEVMSTLHANERAAAERDASLRYELGRLQERLDIQRIVKGALKEFRDGGE